MRRLRIVAVSYLNTIPFVYGIQQSGFLPDNELILAPPAGCAKIMLNDQADIGLVPVVALPELTGTKIITDYCIGAQGAVASVLLISGKPLKDIRTIALDHDSRTSVELIRVLARKFWKITPEIVPQAREQGKETDASLAIGDKCFTWNKSDKMIIDLAEEWFHHTGLPFVFACWVAKNELSEKDLEPFSRAIQYGIEHKLQAIDLIRHTLPQGLDAATYLSHNISFELDEEKRKGLNLFLSYLRGN